MRSSGIVSGEHLIYTNNQGAITIVNSSQTDFHGAQKHFNLKLKQMIKIVNTGLLQLNYMPTKVMPANLLTKALGPTCIHQLIERNSLVQI